MKIGDLVKSKDGDLVGVVVSKPRLAKGFFYNNNDESTDHRMRTWDVVDVLFFEGAVFPMPVNECELVSVNKPQPSSVQQAEGSE